MNDFWSTQDGMSALNASLVSHHEPVSVTRLVLRCRCGRPQRGRSRFRRFIERYVTRNER